MRRRELIRQQFERRVLQAIARRRQAVSAKQLAQELGMPWQIVCGALQRLAAKQDVRVERKEKMGAKSQVRTMSVYWCYDTSEWPDWMRGLG